MTRRLAFATFLLLASCSSSDDHESSYEVLFGAPPAGSTATPDQVLGLWGGRTTTRQGQTFDVRFELTQTKMTTASRCGDASDGFAVVGVSVAIRMSPDTIEILESKSDSKDMPNGRTCMINPRPSTLGYSVQGTQLFLGDETFTKIRD